MSSAKSEDDNRTRINQTYVLERAMQPRSGLVYRKAEMLTSEGEA